MTMTAREFIERKKATQTKPKLKTCACGCNDIVSDADPNDIVEVGGKLVYKSCAERERVTESLDRSPGDIARCPR